MGRPLERVWVWVGMCKEYGYGSVCVKSMGMGRSV